jgi:signal transduction histidine kinase
MGADPELYACCKDGRELPVEISLSPVTTSDGLQVACAIRDISDRKRVLEQLRGAQVEADKANRAKSAFLATASHDLRQPVQAMVLLNAVLQRLVSGPDAVEAVTEQGIALDSMSRLLNTLLDISKLESGSIRPVISTFSAEWLFSALQLEFREQARCKGLQLVVEAGDASVRSDPALVGQVLRNLLANAIKYTPRGQVTLRAVPLGDVLRMEVADTGVGIAPADLGHIFDEFYQVGVPSNSSRDGYGLGLSIVNRIAKLLDLEIAVKSEPERGTAFSFGLPMVPAA